jgi:beta-N-acetylhexosaminidase
LYQDSNQKTITTACIFGCKGVKLSSLEENFFRNVNPLGFILFSRNIKSPQQLKDLVFSLRSCTPHNCFILIDQEGGSVQRLNPPFWKKYPPFSLFGDIYKNNPLLAKETLKLNLQIMSSDLIGLGIDINCSPCLDIPRNGASSIIGNRAFSMNEKTVSSLAQDACLTFIKAGIVPVIKHIPGHGACLVDSHKELPKVNTSISGLKSIDCAPFKSVSHLPVAAMTAHAVYKKVDFEQPATLSNIVIDEIIREFINFKGLLISDDLCMNALVGSFAKRASNSISAGCDIVLHCSGVMKEMEEIANVIKPVSEKALKAIKILDDYRGKPKVEIDKDKAIFNLSNLLSDYELS